jgi:hypothetical protein
LSRSPNEGDLERYGSSKSVISRRPNSRAQSRNLWGWVAGLAVCALASGAAAARAQEPLPPVVEVYWQSSRTLPVLGVTHLVVLDDRICQGRVLTDQIELTGLARGETVALVWIKQQRFSVLIHVIARPATVPPPRLSHAELEALGRGVFGSSVQTFSGSGAETTYFLLHRFDWQQENNGRRLTIRGQAQDSTVPGTPLFNANTASIQYSTPNASFSLIDFPLAMAGGLQGRITPYSAYNTYMIRGADVLLQRGANQYEVFAGVTIPSVYLSLNGTRDVVGFNFQRKQRQDLSLYATTAWVNAPFTAPGTPWRRENSFFQTLGVAYSPTLKWGIQATGGGGTRGGLAQGAVSYTGERLTAFLTGTASSASFPLNQLQLLFAGGSSVTSGATLRLNSRIAGTLYYQHSTTKATAFFPTQGVSDYLNPNLGLHLTSRQALTLNYAYTRSRGGITPLSRTQGRRFDISLNSSARKGTSNTAQVVLGSLSDPLRLNSQAELTLRDVLNVPVRAGIISLAIQHSRNDPSLVKRLSQELSLLSPALQQLFQLDPLAFVESSLLPPELRSLLQNLQPTDTEVTLSGQLHIGSRLNLSPTVGYAHLAQGLNRSSDSHVLGYTLSYQLTPLLQLQSSLSNLLMWDSRLQTLRRNTVLTIGFNKTVTGAPRWFLPWHRRRRAVQGRVFRDLNVNGAYNAGEPGLAGVRVELNTGETALTDREGRYAFSGLAPEAYRVSLPLAQFAEPIRVTSPVDVRVELMEERAAEVNFGVVNFARLMGNVFNDYLLDGKKQPDAPGLRGVRVTITSPAGRWDLTTDGAGDFEVYDLSPGTYQVAADRSTLPPNFVVEQPSLTVEVGPTETVVREIPLQAIRSIAGRVFFKSPDGTAGRLRIPGIVNGSPANQTGRQPPAPAPSGEVQAALKPLAGVKLAVDHSTAVTDEQGYFLLRDLPGGELVVTIVPVMPVPEGMKIPSWKIRLPREPVQVQDATVVISNPDLLRYLVPCKAL